MRRKRKTQKDETINVKYSDVVVVTLSPSIKELASQNCSNKREQKRDSQKNFCTKEKVEEKKLFCIL